AFQLAPAGHLRGGPLRDPHLDHPGALYLGLRLPYERRPQLGAGRLAEPVVPRQLRERALEPPVLGLGVLVVARGRRHDGGRGGARPVRRVRARALQVPRAPVALHLLLGGPHVPPHGGRPAAQHPAARHRAARHVPRPDHPAGGVRASRDDHHPGAVPAGDPPRDRGGRTDRRREPHRVLLAHRAAALAARPHHRRRSGVPWKLERLPAAAARDGRGRHAAGAVDPAARRAAVLHAVLARHRSRARVHLALDGARARVLPRRGAPHRRRSDRRREGIGMSIDVGVVPVWRDASQTTDARVEALVASMTLEEKLAQLYGIWVGASSDGGEVAPHQNDMIDDVDIDELLPTGIGQLTRPFGTAPVDPALGALSLQRTQERIAASNRFGIPAIAHEECLAGFATWGATAYPVPLSWGASFDPDLVRQMASRIGSDMRSVGVHQGLAPVLDVVRDARWGRVEETIGEDPYLVGTIATADVQGLERAGVIATLKHFVGYSASKAGRNLAPVSVGPRELADVLLPPFEMAIRESGVRSVMNAYTDIDGVPTAADASLLTGLLRERWGFDGTVVADYFSVGFLASLHGIAAEGDWGAASVAALTAGIDVELPTVRGYGAPLAQEVRAGRIDEALVDRSLRRVLAQKIELGLLDPDWSPTPPALEGADASAHSSAADALRGTIDLDSAGNRHLAEQLAERA